jgi:putative zinc finger/helix-turn-helix YgiT family protein
MSEDDRRWDPSGHAEVCPECGSTELTTRIEEEKFRYGSGKAAVQLEAIVPITECDRCNYVFYPAGAEEAKHKAVCQYLGVMPPDQIAAIRHSLGMTRAELSELTGLGEATIGRWERGAVIQNVANDQYLFLLGFSDNVDRLRRRNDPLGSDNGGLGENIPISVKFPALQNAGTAAEQARNFHLRTG